MLDVVPNLVTALWPVLWQRWLKDVEHAAEIYEHRPTGRPACCAPLGPSPAIRVGDVPYGVLPAVDLEAWRAARHDPVWEQAIPLVA